MRISITNRPQILITMGDPSGIGPEIIAKSMASPELRGLAVFVVIADSGVMERAFRDVYDDIVVVHRLKETTKELCLKKDAINVVDPSPPLANVISGCPTDEGAAKTLECLAQAVNMMRSPSDRSVPRALVTAPVSKKRIARVSPGFVGHTEYLREAYSSEMVTMVLTGKTLCVVPVTRHIPLKDVAARLSADLIERTLTQVISDREIICGKEDALIGVAALNPHCGEDGKIGTEEIDVIAPAVERTKKRYEKIIGPVSADVIFYQAMRGKVDIVVSMYHDQCLAPFKMVDFDHGVNMTLGLEHVRTSPDHGTAFDIAGKGIASPGSMIQAIKLAIRAVA